MKVSQPLLGYDPQEPLQYHVNHDAAHDLVGYLKVDAKQQYWVDDLLLSVLSNRLGCIFVIFCWNEDAEVWIRFVQAPKFDKGVAIATGKYKQPVVLRLSGRHCTGFCPKDLGFECPHIVGCSKTKTTKSALHGCECAALHDCDSDSGISLPPNTPPRSPGIQCSPKSPQLAGPALEVAQSEASPGRLSKDASIILPSEPADHLKHAIEGPVLDVAQSEASLGRPSNDVSITLPSQPVT